MPPVAGNDAWPVLRVATSSSRRLAEGQPYLAFLEPSRGAVPNSRRVRPCRGPPFTLFDIVFGRKTRYIFFSTTQMHETRTSLPLLRPRGGLRETQPCRHFRESQTASMRILRIYRTIETRCEFVVTCRHAYESETCVELIKSIRILRIHWTTETL